MSYTPQPALANLQRPHTLDDVNRFVMGRVVATWPATDTVDVELLAGGRLSHVPVLKAAAGRAYGDADLPPVTAGYGTATATSQNDTYCAVGFLNGDVRSPFVMGFIGPYDSAMLKRPAGSALRRSVGKQTEVAYADGSYELRTDGASLRMGTSATLTPLDPALDPGSNPATQLQLANSAGARLTLDASGSATLGGNVLTLAPDTNPAHAVTIDSIGLTLRGKRLAVTGQDVTLAATGASATTLSLASSGSLDLKTNSLTLNGNLTSSAGTLALGGNTLTLGGSLSVGASGGTFNPNGNTLNVSSNSTLHLGGNALVIGGTGNLTVSNGGGTLALTGKTLTLSDNLTSSGGTLNLNGFALTMSTGGTLNLGGNTLTLSSNGTLDLGGRTLGMPANKQLTIGSATLALGDSTTIGTIASGSGGTVTKTLLFQIGGNAITLFGN